MLRPHVFSEFTTLFQFVILFRLLIPAKGGPFAKPFKVRPEKRGRMTRAPVALGRQYRSTYDTIHAVRRLGHFRRRACRRVVRPPPHVPFCGVVCMFPRTSRNGIFRRSGIVVPERASSTRASIPCTVIVFPDLVVVGILRQAHTPRYRFLQLFRSCRCKV